MLLLFPLKNNYHKRLAPPLPMATGDLGPLFGLVRFAICSGIFRAPLPKKKERGSGLKTVVIAKSGEPTPRITCWAKLMLAVLVRGDDRKGNVGNVCHMCRCFDPTKLLGAWLWDAHLHVWQGVSLANPCPNNSSGCSLELWI